VAARRSSRAGLDALPPGRLVTVTGDRGIRRLTAAAVLLVAAIAAVVSFIHIENLAVTHGQTELAAWLLPVSVDGTVAGAPLSMLWAARSGLSTPWLARCMLTLGVLATLGANIGYGAPYGWSGELLSGWPAVAFVGSVEMVLSMVRRARTEPAVSDPVAPHPLTPSNGHTVPEGGREAAEKYAASLARRELPSLRQVQREMHLGPAPGTRGAVVSRCARPKQRARPGVGRGRCAPLVAADGALPVHGSVRAGHDLPRRESGTGLTSPLAPGRRPRQGTAGCRRPGQARSGAAWCCRSCRA